MSRLGQRKIVWVSGISPLIANSDGGIALYVAIISAADDDSPIAQTAPSPR